MQEIRIGVLVGSLRKGAYSKAVADAICARMPPGFQMKGIPLGGLELFCQDLEEAGKTPESWLAFREAVKGMDGFLFVTPEYNRSYPAVLKNALDIASRPYGANLWAGKPGAVVSVSPGKLGGFGANHHLRQVLSFLDVYVMQQPEAYFGNVEAALEADGGLEALGFIGTIAQAFAEWVRRFA